MVVIRQCGDSGSVRVAFLVALLDIMEREPRTNEVAATLKVFVACIPPTLLIYRFHVENHLLVGLSSIAGLLLQTLVPPWRLGFVRMLTATALFTLVYSVSNPTWSAWYPLVLTAGVVFLVEVLMRIVRYCSRAQANVAKGIGFPTV